METMVNQNIEQNNETQETGGFWHSGWAFLVFFMALIGIMIVISLVVKRFM